MTGRAIAGGLAVGAAAGSNVANIGAIAERLTAQYGVGLATIGLFTTALFVFHAAVQIPGGNAVDRFGARRLGLAALIVVAVFNALAMITSAAALGIGARALMGLGTGVAFIAGSDYIRSSGGSPFAQGLYGGIGVGGGGLSLALVPQLEHAVSWRAPFLFCLCIAAGALALLLTCPPDAARPGERSSARMTSLQLIGERRLVRLSIIHTASFGLNVVIANWTVTLLEHHGYGESSASVLGSITLLASIVGRPLGGWLLRRGSSPRLAVGLGLLLGGLGCLGLAVSGPGPLAAASAIVTGIAAGIPFAPAFTAAALIRPDAPGAAIGLINMWGSLAILAGTPLLGLAFRLPGDGRIGFVVVGVLWAAAALALPRAWPLTRSPQPAR